MEVSPLDTVDEVIVKVGDVVSYESVNCVAAVLPLPAASVKVSADTSIVTAVPDAVIVAV